MIFVSSSGVHHDSIMDSIGELLRVGFRAIELSGGTKPVSGILAGLKQLQNEHGLSYRLHNYFPPPPVPFVINLSSSDPRILEQSMDHLKRSIELSHQLRTDAFAFHAGFRCDFGSTELGQTTTQRSLIPNEEAWHRLLDSVIQLKDFAGDLPLFLENNVITKANLDSHRGQNPLLLTTPDEWHSHGQELQSAGINLLLDLAHLHVSCHSLQLDFNQAARDLLGHCNYLHLSANDGLRDSNGPLANGSAEWLALCNSPQSKHSRVTLEVYSGIPDLLHSHRLAQSFFSPKEEHENQLT